MINLSFQKNVLVENMKLANKITLTQWIRVQDHAIVYRRMPPKKILKFVRKKYKCSQQYSVLMIRPNLRTILKEPREFKQT